MFYTSYFKYLSDPKLQKLLLCNAMILITRKQKPVSHNFPVLNQLSTPWTLYNSIVNYEA